MSATEEHEHGPIHRLRKPARTDGGNSRHPFSAFQFAPFERTDNSEVASRNNERSNELNPQQPQDRRDGVEERPGLSGHSIPLRSPLHP